MSKFKTQFTDEYGGANGEVNTQPSKTIPNQARTISELFDRFARGLPVEGAKVEVWNGSDDDLPDVSKLDLADRQELIENTVEEIKRLKESAKKSAQKNTDELVEKKKNQQQPELGLPVPDGDGNPKDFNQVTDKTKK